MKYEVTANRLKGALSMRDLKPQELADKSGVNKASISQYVNGKNKPSIENAMKMGKVLSVPPEWLMGYDFKELPIDNKDSLTDDEKDILIRYRNADEQTKLMVLRILAFESLDKR